MKLIHTSDWHLGARLHEEDRAAEHKAFLEWLLGQIQEETQSQQQQQQTDPYGGSNGGNYGGNDYYYQYQWPFSSIFGW